MRPVTIFWVLVGLLISLAAGCRFFETKVTKITPTTAYYDTDTTFTIEGQNLSSFVVVNLDKTISCTADTSTPTFDGSKLLARCKTPASGDYTLLYVTDGKDTLKDGKAKISLTYAAEKLSANGAVLDQNASNYACLKDIKTGYIWSVPNAEATSPYYSGHQYYFQQTGAGQTGTCRNSLGGKDCNTYNLIERANQTQLCGKSAWALPSASLIRSYIYNCNTGLPINRLYPLPAQSFYWTNSFSSTSNIRLQVNSCADLSSTDNLTSGVILFTQ